MNSIQKINMQNVMWDIPQTLSKSIRLVIDSTPCSPEVIVEKLASINGPVDIYTWYEGPQYLPKSGALFLKNRIFEPLYKVKKDAKWYLYSLCAWNFNKNITQMPPATKLGKAVNSINTTAVECIYSSSFFNYCTEISKVKRLYTYLKDEIVNKEWLKKLSDGREPSGVKVSEFFNNQPSLFDGIQDSDMSSAYSCIQYVEGYYLIRESVQRALLKEQKKVEIAFVLPNDESKYYKDESKKSLDLKKEIQKLLELEFGEDRLADVEIRICFRFFEYNQKESRPYIDKAPNAPKIKPPEIPSYFDYLSKQPTPEKSYNTPFQRDIIHNLNGWY